MWIYHEVCDTWSVQIQPTVTFNHGALLRLTGTVLNCLVTEARVCVCVCKQLVHGRHARIKQLGIEPHYLLVVSPTL